jgi:hypothetical protein
VEQQVHQQHLLFHGRLFRGTAISLTQHCDHSCEHSDLTNNLGDFSGQGKTLKMLSTSYIDVPPVTALKKDFTLPQSDVSVTADCGQFASEITVEYRWLRKVSLLFSTDDVDSDDRGTKINFLEKFDLSFFIFFDLITSLLSQVTSFISRSVLLPMFCDPAQCNDYCYECYRNSEPWSVLAWPKS